MTAIFWTFIFLIMLAPLPFGMVHAVVQALFACLILLLMAAWSLLQMRDQSASGVPLRMVVWETTAFTIIIGWALLQMLPVTPAALHHPLWEETGLALGREIAGAISLSPGAGFQSLVRLVAYGCVFWLAMQLGRDRRRARRFMDLFILAAALYTVYGLLMEIEGIRKILWVEKTSAIGVVTGTFVNRNTFATYAGLALLCAVGAYFAAFLDMARQKRRGRDRIVAFLNMALIQGAPRLASILILTTGLFLSGSRGGIVASLAALAMLLILLATMQSRHRRIFGLVAGALMVAFVITATTSGDRFFWRMTATDLSEEFRFKAYAQIWQAVDGAPWTGFGLGSFAQAFPLYADLKTSQWDKAHNDWLEMIFELGWPAALLWFGLLAGLAIRCLVGFFRRRRDHLYPLVGFCAALLVGMHAFVDFSLQVPAVAAGFSALLGIGVAQSYSSGR